MIVLLHWIVLHPSITDFVAVSFGVEFGLCTFVNAFRRLFRSLRFFLRHFFRWKMRNLRMKTLFGDTNLEYFVIIETYGCKQVKSLRIVRNLYWRWQHVTACYSKQYKQKQLLHRSSNWQMVTWCSFRLETALLIALVFENIQICVNTVCFKVLMVVNCLFLLSRPSNPLVEIELCWRNVLSTCLDWRMLRAL